MPGAYMRASGNGTLPAKARQVYYQARPKIMAITDDKELRYGYFSQTLLPDYVEEQASTGMSSTTPVVHFEEPHTNRRIGCGTIEVGNYLAAMKNPDILAADFPQPTSTLSVRPEISAAIMFARRRASARCSGR